MSSLIESDSDKTVYLIDGSTYVYKSYYAIKELYNSMGEPTNAILGFVNILMKIIKQKKPKYLGIFFDVKGPTFRHNIYEQYKANRSSTPDNLIKQFSRIKQINSALGLPFFEMAGFEADDLIGTTVRILRSYNLSVVIITADKDLMQLVDDNCMIWEPVKNIIIDVNSIRDKFSVNPDQLVDVMGFSGDKVDNIPGVPGIGPKTASKLISKFGSMDKCYKRLDEIINKKQKEKLLKFKSQAFLSLSLVKINTCVPFKIKIEDLLITKSNNKLSYNIFKNLEFKKLQKKFACETTKLNKLYRLINTIDVLDKLAFDLSRCHRFAFKFETDSSNPMIAKLIGISISMQIGKTFYIAIAHDYPGVEKQLSLNLVLKTLRSVMLDSKIEKISQNLRFSSVILMRYGIRINGIIFDTMLASYLINSSRKDYDLDQIALDFLDRKISDCEDFFSKGKNKISFNKVDIITAMNFSCERTEIIFALADVLTSILKKNDLINLMMEIEMPLISVLARMEVIGIQINEIILQKLLIFLKNELSLLENKIYKSVGEVFNIRSSQELGYVLFSKLGLPIQKKTKISKKYSTDVSVLTKLRHYHPIPELILKHRSLSKFKSSYADAILRCINSETGRLHTSFNQTVTVTGRLSSSNPNLQNVPVRTKVGRKIRKAFVAVENCHFLSADYSQIELRVLAHYSKDPILIESFRKDEDIHIRTASEIFQIVPENVNKELRNKAKTINFGIIYGMSAYRLAEEFGVSHKIAQTYINNYFEKYKGVKRFIDKSILKAVETKKVKTMFGRIRHLDAIRSNNKNLRKSSERAAFNTIIQGTAADLLKVAMVNVSSVLIKAKLSAEILLSVHDEIILEVPNKEKNQVENMVKNTMENVCELAVPLKVNILSGKNLAEVH